MISFSAIFLILGWLLMFFGGAMQIPAGVSYFAYGEDIGSFFQAGCAAFFVGALLVLMNRGNTHQLSHKDAFLLTFLVWVMLSFVSAMPFYMSDVTPNFVDAYFEAVSGLTTTGASVLTGLDDMHHGILLWRSMLQWFGGMGVIVLATAIIPFLGVGGMQLYRAEMPGVVKDKLQPRLKETAGLLWGVYLVLTLICTVGFMLAGMGAFDAVCHAFSTVATGGYSTHDASFAYFDSPAIERVAIFFMIIGAINFTLHYTFLSGRGLKAYASDSEFKTFAAVLLVAVAVVSVVLALGDEYTVSESVRHAMFNITSVLTTTGFASQDFSSWYVLIPMLILVLAFIGGCSGSTAGGMKVLRVMLINKHGRRELQRMIHPHGVVHVKVANRMVPDHVLQAVWSFAGLYIVCFMMISFLLSGYGIDLVTAFSAAAATLTGLGPGLGDVGPHSNYGWLPDGAKVLLTFSMLLGRLELFTLLVLITPEFWRK